MKRSRFVRFLRHASSRSALDVLTGSGKVVLIACSVCLFAFWGYPFISLFSGFITLLGLSWILNIYLTPRLGFQTHGDFITFAGEDAVLDVVVNNSTGNFARDLTLDWTGMDRTWRSADGPQCIGTIDPGKQVSIQIRFKTLKRGVYEWPRIRIESTFPFGLCSGKQFSQFQSELFVAPKRYFDDEWEGSRELVALVGDILSRNVSQGSDYLGSREYIPGAPPGRWDFASWGRLGKPICREMAAENQSSILIFVDLFCELSTQRKKQIDSFERMLEISVAFGEHFRRKRIAVSYLIPEFSKSIAITWHNEDSALRTLAVCKPIVIGNRILLDSVFVDAPGFDRRQSTTIAVTVDESPENRERIRRWLPEHRIEFIGVKLEGQYVSGREGKIASS